MRYRGQETVQRKEDLSKEMLLILMMKSGCTEFKNNPRVMTSVLGTNKKGSSLMKLRVNNKKVCC